MRPPIKHFPIPEQLPPRRDPTYGNVPGPYSRSDLGGITGTLSNPAAIEAEQGRDLTNPTAALNYAHPDLQRSIREIKGFDARAKLQQRPAAEWPLTGIITRIGLGANGTVDLAPFPGTYIIDYLKLSPGRDGLPRHDWANHIKQQLPGGSRLLLSFFNFAIERPTSGLWTLSDAGFWSEPFLDQFDGILLYNSNAFSNSPIPQLLQGERMDQIVLSEAYTEDQEIRDRGQSAYPSELPAPVTYSILSGKTNSLEDVLDFQEREQSVPIIPCIAWGHQESSLRRQIELLVSKQPAVNTICVDAHGPGLDRTLWTWRWLFALEKYAQPQPNIRWIISGITSGWAIRELNRIFPEGNFHLVLSLSAYVHAKAASADPELQEEYLRRAVSRLERLRLGVDKATEKDRPDHWPTFLEAGGAKLSAKS